MTNPPNGPQQGSGFPQWEPPVQNQPVQWQYPPQGQFVQQGQYAQQGQYPQQGQWPAPAPQWQLPTKAEPLPVQLRQYQEFWRSPRWSWWRPVVATVLALVLFLVSQTVALIVAMAADAASGRVPLDQAMEELGQSTTPAFFAANNVSLASLIPISMLIAWWVTGQRPKWLTGVVGGFRWGWFARCVGLLLPLWLVYIGIEWWAISQSDEGLGLKINNDTWFLLATILITTPLQAAGEEYGFRGLLNRAAASFFKNRTLGLLVGLIFSSCLFMLAHGAGDPWLNLFYFCFGAIACIMTWRTGGLEAAIAMHAVNNLLSEASLPFSDISDMFNREAGTADASVLIGVVVPLIGLALVEWQARRQQIIRATAPAAALQPQRLGAKNQPALS
ncbi:hypothetical protein GCM10009638_05220 [Luteococcus sanguinis]